MKRFGSLFWRAIFLLLVLFLVTTALGFIFGSRGAVGVGIGVLMLAAITAWVVLRRRGRPAAG